MGKWLAAFEALSAEHAGDRSDKNDKTPPADSFVTSVSIVTGMSDPKGVFASALIPSEWMQGVARLRSMPTPDSIPRGRWQQVVFDATRLLSEWGQQAAALGWSTFDLFGVHRTRPVARYDAMGLVMVLDGSRVAALTDADATIRTRGGAIQTYCRPFNGPDQVAIWDLLERGST